MSLSIRRASSLALLAVFCIIPFTTALPGGLRPRQDIKLSELFNFVPSCARQCVATNIAPKDCSGDQIESCLCGRDPQGFKDSIWQCIDGNCGGPGSDFHQAAIVGVEGLCGASISTTPAATLTSTKQVTQTVTQTQSSSLTTVYSLILPSVIRTASTSGVVPTVTTVISGETEAHQSQNRNNRTGLSTPAIIGISVGAFCLLAAVVGAFFFCMIAKRKNHRNQAQSMTFEPHSPRGGAAVWLTINSTSSTTLVNSYAPSQRVTSIDTNVANEKPHAHRSRNISPVSPVSPTAPQGFEFGETVQQQSRTIGSQRITEDPHLFVAPTVMITPSSSLGTMGQTSLVLPVLAPPNSSVDYYGSDLPGMAISTDLPETSSLPLDSSSTNHYTYSTVTPTRYPDHPSDPPIPSSPPPEYAPSPVSESPNSTRSFAQASHGPSTMGISRSDTLSWRRELNEAAGRAVTRVLHSEQSVNEEIDAAKRRKGSIPGLERFSRRLSRDNRAGEENILVGAERGMFWTNFQSWSNRDRGSPPRHPSFLNKRSNSGGNTRPRSERPSSVQEEGKT